MCGLPFSGKTDYAEDLFGGWANTLHQGELIKDELEDSVIVNQHTVSKAIIDTFAELSDSVKDSLNSCYDTVLDAGLHTPRARREFISEIKRSCKDIEFIALTTPKLTLTEFAKRAVNSGNFFDIDRLTEIVGYYKPPTEEEGFTKIINVDDEDLWSKLYS